MNNLDKIKELITYSETLVKSNKIKIDANAKLNVIQQIALYIDSLIFNIVSLFCIIAIINNSNKITDNTVTIAKKYIDNKCKIMKGGDCKGAPWHYNKNEPTYNVTTFGKDLLDVGFDKGILRPQIGGPQTGGGGSKNTKISKYMNYIFKYHNMKVTPEIKSEILSLIYFHIDCLINILCERKKPLTVSAFKSIIKKNKIIRPFA